MQTIGFFNIKKIYIENTKYDNYNKIYFKGDGGVLSKIEHIYKEKYSYTHKKEADILSNYIKEIIDNDIENSLIIDGTTSLGGNLISLIKYFKFIIGIEINNIRFNKLLSILSNKYLMKFVKNENNLIPSIFSDNNNSNNIFIKKSSIYTSYSNKKKIILINDSFDNYIEYINEIKIKNKIIYLDPPWGGKNYKNYNNIILGLGGIPLHILVKNLKNLDNNLIIILKLPLNYHLSSFSNKINHIQKLEKFYYICL